MINSFPFSQDIDSWTSSSPSAACTADGSVSLDDCWENVIGDDIDWNVHSGSTGSSNTGPSADYSGTGQYLYTEASSCYSSIGYVKSPNFDLTSIGGANLEFYYHMYGESMGTLSVQVSTDGGSNWSSDVWSLSGDQDNQWLLATIPLDSYLTSNNFVFRFKAITGTSYKSDMAIDAISITVTASCAGPTQPSTSFEVIDINDNDLTVNWTRGNGTAVLVVAKQGGAVDQNPVSGNTYSADAEFAMGDDLGSGNYVIYNGTGTSVVTTLLDAATNYHFEVFEYFSSDNCYATESLIGNETTTGEPPSCSVCPSDGTMDYATSTTFVEINTISNLTAKPASFCDYTAITTSLEVGSTHDLSVRVNTDGNYTVQTKAWIDWNQDCDFDDAGEEFDLGAASNVADGLTDLSPLSIYVPVDALLGNTTMRVSTKYSSDPSSCETGFDGEVEDYTINVIPAVVLWNGTTASWDDPLNWPGGILPNSSYEVTIPTSPVNGNFPNIPEGVNAKCFNLTLEEGAILTIEGTLEIEN